MHCWCISALWRLFVVSGPGLLSRGSETGRERNGEPCAVFEREGEARTARATGLTWGRGCILNLRAAACEALSGGFPPLLVIARRRTGPTVARKEWRFGNGCFARPDSSQDVSEAHAFAMPEEAAERPLLRRVRRRGFAEASPAEAERVGGSTNHPFPILSSSGRMQTLGTIDRYVGMGEGAMARRPTLPAGLRRRRKSHPWGLREAAARAPFCRGRNSVSRGAPRPELTDGGSNTVSKAVALCPNFHRFLHHSPNAAVAVANLYTSV